MKQGGVGRAGHVPGGQEGRAGGEYDQDICLHISDCQEKSENYPSSLSNGGWRYGAAIENTAALQEDHGLIPSTHMTAHTMHRYMQTKHKNKSINLIKKTKVRRLNLGQANGSVSEGIHHQTSANWAHIKVDGRASSVSQRVLQWQSQD